jgi:hypothetical protein
MIALHSGAQEILVNPKFITAVEQYRQLHGELPNMAAKTRIWIAGSGQYGVRTYIVLETFEVVRELLQKNGM